MRNNSTWTLSAPSPTIWPRKGWHPGWTILTLVGVVAVLFLATFVYEIIALAAGTVTMRQLSNLPPDQLLLTQIVTWPPVILFLLPILPKLSHASLRDLGFRAPTRGELGIALAGVVAMLVLVDGTSTLAALLSHQHDKEQAVVLLEGMKTPLEKSAFFFMGCLLVPFGEELVFRAFLFNAIAQWVRSERAKIPVAAVVSGVLFGILHMSFTKSSELLTIAPGLTLGGIVLAYVYAKTKCFWANVTTHATFNAVSVIAAFVFHLT